MDNGATSKTRRLLSEALVKLVRSVLAENSNTTSVVVPAPAP